MAQIVVRRSAAWGDKLREYRIIVDGAACGSIAERGEARIAVAPGRHVVRLKIDWCWSAPLTVDVEDGKEHVLECGPNANPFLVLLYISFWKNRYLWLRDSGATALAPG